jgi:hypothetical protein
VILLAVIIELDADSLSGPAVIRKSVEAKTEVPVLSISAADNELSHFIDHAIRQSTVLMNPPSQRNFPVVILQSAAARVDRDFHIAVMDDSIQETCNVALENVEF